MRGICGTTGMPPHRFYVAVAAGYVLYMMCFFKTRWSVHHPLEQHLVSDTTSWLAHPLSSGAFESKICPLGKLVALLMALWLVLRTQKTQHLRWNVCIWAVVLVLGSLLNLNFVLYLLPVVLAEKALGFL